MDRNKQTVLDIFHPRASLNWSSCGSMPIGMVDAQATWLEDKLYVGGGQTAGSPRDHAQLYIYSTTDLSWSTIDTPVYHFGLVAYKSKRLLLLGGRNSASASNEPAGTIVNTVWEFKMGKSTSWVHKFPPMKVRRSFASPVCFEKSIIVSGGESEKGKIASIEIFDDQDHQWTCLSHSLPKASSRIKSIVFGGSIYMLGGDGQDKKLFRALLSSLLTGDYKWNSSDMPCEWSAPVVFRKRLMVFGGSDEEPSAAIYAFSPSVNKWIHVGDMPKNLYSASVVAQCSGELMAIGGMTKTGFSNEIFTATLTAAKCDPDDYLCMKDILGLEEAEHIKLLASLSSKSDTFQRVIGMGKPVKHPYTAFEQWIDQQQPSIAPTWKKLLLVLRLLDLEQIAERIESCIYGTPKASKSADSEDFSKPKRRKIHSSESQVSAKKSRVSSETSTSSRVQSASATTKPKQDLNLDYKHHSEVAGFLRMLPKEAVIQLGLALGLSYGKLRNMKQYPDEMVDAWLRKEDDVLEKSGPPTWRSLINAVRAIKQEGIAQDIEKQLH